MSWKVAKIAWKVSDHFPSVANSGAIVDNSGVKIDYIGVKVENLRGTFSDYFHQVWQRIPFLTKGCGNL